MFLSMKQVCDLLNWSRWKVTELIQEGELQAHKGPQRNAHYRILRRSVDRYIERRMLTVGGNR